MRTRPPSIANLLLPTVVFFGFGCGSDSSRDTAPKASSAPPEAGRNPALDPSERDAHRHAPQPILTPLTRENVGQIRKVFNAGSRGPRLVVFFSSGCSACDEGSAALQEVFEQVDGPATVLAVWEPISPSDPLPTNRMIGNLRDRRVHQLWDPEHVMSDEMRASEAAHPSSIPQARLRMDKQDSGILYDTVALFAPGARWEATLPAPVYLDGGLAAVLDEVHRRLDAMTREPR